MREKYALNRLLAMVVALALVVGETREAPAVPLAVYEGRVVAVNRYAVTLEDPRDLSRRSFSINQSTKIMRNGNLARFNDLQPGDSARISVRPLGDKLLALTITAQSPL